MAKKVNGESAEKAKRFRVSQSDVPAYSLSDALRVARAIAENYGSQPTKPFNVAAAMELSPSSSQFRMLTGASIAYGLTDGTYNAAVIGLTELGKKITSPLEEGADLKGRVEAFLRPRIISEFMNKYDGHPIPRDEIAINVLTEMGVPKERATNVLALIMDGAESLGLISQIKGKRYVNLTHASEGLEGLQEVEPDEYELAELGRGTNGGVTGAGQESAKAGQAGTRGSSQTDERAKRVFITHGKNREFVDPIRKLLTFGDLEAVVSVEKQTVSQPVSEKVLNDMRACGAAIIHVDGEQTLIDKEANEHVILNPNVLIEIGAAMALYGTRFILLVKEGVKVPSNLQGLYEVRYTGENLDSDATIRLLEAIRQLKSIPIQGSVGQ